MASLNLDVTEDGRLCSDNFTVFSPSAAVQAFSHLQGLPMQYLISSTATRPRITDTDVIASSICNLLIPGTCRRDRTSRNEVLCKSNPGGVA